MEFLARFFGIWMVFVICIAVGVEGVAFGVACSGDGDCDDANNKCDTGGSGNCICADDSFRRTSPAECVIKIVAGSTCIAGDTCADTNAACDTSALQCLCTAATHFQKNDNTCAAQVAALDGTCVTAETATDQCAIAGSECRTAQCLCKDTHYRSGTTCTAKIALNAACTASPTGQCADSLAACDGSALLCKCTTGNFEKNDGTCAAQIPNLEDTCATAETASDQCTVADSECRAAQCLCKDTHYKTGSTCTIRKKPDETGCGADECVTHATCVLTATPTICECDAGYTATPTTNPTMCSGVVKFASLSYMYVVPILVSLMFLVR